MSSIIIKLTNRLVRPLPNRLLRTRAQQAESTLVTSQSQLMLLKSLSGASRSTTRQRLSGSSALRLGRLPQVHACIPGIYILSRHCQRGMVFAVNPTPERTFEAFQAAAMGGSASASGSASGAATGTASGSGADASATDAASGALSKSSFSNAASVLAVVGVLAGSLL